MNLLNLIPGFSWAKVVGVLALLAALSAATWKVYHSGMVTGRAEIQTQLDAERLDRANERTAIAAKSFRALEWATSSTLGLQTQADQSRKALNEKIKSLDSDLVAAHGLLNDRPVRPTDGAGGVPPGAADRAGGPGATGAGLYREDGQFLAGFARDAEVIRAGLKACYRDYDAIRQELDQLHLRPQ